METHITLNSVYFSFSGLLSFGSFPLAPHRIPDWRQWYWPLTTAIMGAILIPTAFVNLDTYKRNADARCEGGPIDGDVAGKGVRIAMWLQMGTLAFILIIGTFHSKVTGAKEIGAGLIATHLSLAIALLYQFSRSTLTPTDIIVGCMILDAQNLTLSMHLTAMETLARRWQVCITIATQLFGLATIGFLMVELFESSFNTSECRCITVYWWGWLENCSSTEEMLFGDYCFFRIASFFAQSLNAGYNAFQLCGANGKYRDEENGAIGDRSIGMDRSTDFYSQYPATISFTYMSNGVFAVASLTAAELLLIQMNLQPTSSLGSTGQIISLGIAGVTVSRAIWLLARLFMQKNSLGLIWPFPKYSSKVEELGPETYILTTKGFCQDNNLKLGDVVGVTPDACRLLLSSDRVPRGSVRRAEAERYSWSSTRRFGIPLLPYIDVEKRTETLSEGRIQVNSFNPSECYIKENVPKFIVDANLITRFCCGDSILMVTGIMTGTGCLGRAGERMRGLSTARNCSILERASQANGNKSIIGYRLACIRRRDNGELYACTPRLMAAEYDFIDLVNS